MVRIKRVYEPASADDMCRILVDRLWPRGFTKEKAHVDMWMKDVAPSNSLREWFGHNPEKWDEFHMRYEKELWSKWDMVEKIKEFERELGTVTLVYAAKDEMHNNALALADVVKILEHPLEACC
jgi:uncharacterized protein YeaO (DUF488 family)